MTPWSDGLLESGFGSPRVAEAVSWEARIATMLEVEAALARAQARLDVIPPAAAEAIAAACDPDALDLAQLAREAASAATPVIPLVRVITERAGSAGGGWVHHGATSQDIIDTAMVLVARRAITLIEGELMAAGDACEALAAEHVGTVMAGRTLGQQAVPISFGLKAARWLGMLDRRVEQLRTAATHLSVVQLGGAAGTLSVLGRRGLDVAEALGQILGLSVPDLPWHGERDRIAELAGALAGVSAAAATIGTDVVLLSQSEIAEAAEAPGGQAGSSAMPHKRNPVHATAARAAARLAMGDISVLLHGGEHEHERSAGAWQAEWVALPGALVRTAGAVERIALCLQGLGVDGERARRNLADGFGLTASEAIATALAPSMGRAQAQSLVAELAGAAVTEGRDLTDLAAADERVAAVLSSEELAAAADPAAGLLLAEELVSRALRRHRELVDESP